MKVHPSPCVTCHMSRVTCQVSGVRCQVSGVRCNFFYVGGGYVINGPTPSSFSSIRGKTNKFCHAKKCEKEKTDKRTQILTKTVTNQVESVTLAALHSTTYILGRLRKMLRRYVSLRAPLLEPLVV